LCQPSSLIIHPSAWKWNSANFALTESYEVRQLRFKYHSFGGGAWYPMIATVVTLYNTAGTDAPRPIESSLAMATATPVQPAAPRRGFKGLLARHPLVSYFLITFTWLLFLPGPLTYYGLLKLNPSALGMLAIAGLLGPILSGFIMTALIEGREGVGDLLRRVVLWRVGLQWYLFALLGLPVVMLLGTLVRPGALESFDLSAQPFTLAYLVAFVSMVLIGGPLF
jgi:hypothetical protein